MNYKTKKRHKLPRHTRSRNRRKRIFGTDHACWGKNKPLEQFWQKLASGKQVVVVYKNGTHKYVSLPKPSTKKYGKMFDEFDENADIVAVLSSNASQDSYERFLYPKAKDNSVEYVIKNYKKYFKLIGGMFEHPLMKKVHIP